MSTVVASEVGGDLHALRTHNTRRLLGALLGAPGGLSVSEIVTATDLSRSTVVSLIGSLPSSLIRATDRSGGGNPGRRGRLVWIEPSAITSVGVDLGRTHVAVGATDSFGRALSDPSITSKALGADPDRYLSDVSSLVQEHLGELGVPCSRVACITIGFAGAVNALGEVADTAHPEWTGTDLRAEIVERWPRGEAPPATFADNDANLGGLAEHRFGAGRDARSLLYVKWSSGIGSAVIIDGAVWRGHGGQAGELGHLPVLAKTKDARALSLPAVADRIACPRCGHANCLEMLAGGKQVARATGAADLKAVVRMALNPDHDGQRRAIEALQAAARLIGRGMGAARVLLDLERFVVGGLVGRELYDLLAEDLREGVASTAIPSRRLDLKMGQLGDRATVLGAAAAGVEQHGVDLLLAATAV